MCSMFLKKKLYRKSVDNLLLHDNIILEEGKGSATFYAKLPEGGTKKERKNRVSMQQWVYMSLYMRRWHCSPILKHMFPWLIIDYFFSLIPCSKMTSSCKHVRLARVKNVCSKVTPIVSRWDVIKQHDTKYYRRGVQTIFRNRFASQLEGVKLMFSSL